MYGRSIRIYIGLKDYFEKQPRVQQESTISNRFTQRTDQPELHNVHSVRILESSSLNDGFVEIDFQKIDARQTQFITTTKYTDPSNWFKFELVAPPEDLDNPSGILAKTDATFSEELGSIVDNVRTEIGDLSLENPSFTDEEYIRKIRLAFRRYKGSERMSYVDESDVPVIALLVRMDICRILAFDHAKYYTLSSPSAQLNKWEIGEHYLSVARDLESSWNSLKGDLGLSSGGKNEDGILEEMPNINVGTLKRFSHRAGRVVDDTSPIRRRWARQWI